MLQILCILQSNMNSTSIQIHVSQNNILWQKHWQSQVKIKIGDQELNINNEKMYLGSIITNDVIMVKKGISFRLNSILIRKKFLKTCIWFIRIMADNFLLKNLEFQT